MKRLALSLMLAGAAAVCGCSQHREDRTACETPAPTVAASPVPAMPVTPATPRLASGLIFDRVPGSYSADQFAVRSDWPSADSYYRRAEFVFYREHFHNVQGPGQNNFNNTYRRFDTYRYGEGVR